MTKSSPLIWHLLHNVKSTVKISSIFVGFSEKMNFNNTQLFHLHKSTIFIILFWKRIWDCNIVLNHSLTTHFFLFNLFTFTPVIFFLRTHMNLDKRILRNHKTRHNKWSKNLYKVKFVDLWKCNFRKALIPF